MRFRSAAIFLLLAVATCQYTCPKIKCGSVTEQPPAADEDICVKKTSSGNDALYQLKLCPSPMAQTCNFSLEVTVGNCTATEIPEKSLYPGDPCLYGKHCISGACPEHFCVGTPLGSPCTNDIQCVAGAFCNYQGKCDKLVEAGQPCGRGPSKGTCQNHLTCTLGRCIPIGGLPEGNETDNNLACPSLFAKVDNAGKLRCHPGPKLKGGSSQPSECQIGTPCTYSFDGSDESFTKSCKCGVNGNGKSYCHPGEGAMSSDVSKFLQFASKPFNVSCHISNPWFCARRLVDNPKEYHIGRAAHFNITVPELFVDNDLCVQWNVHKVYWTSYNIANQEEKPNNTSDGSMTVKASMSILLLLLLIELALLI